MKTCCSVFRKIFRQTTPFVRRAGLLVACVGLSTTATQAQSSRIKIVGLGAATCAQFITDVETNPAIQRDYLAWAQGYMSGIIVSQPPGVDETLDLSPLEWPLMRQLEFLRARCATRQVDDFADAAEDLYRQLRGNVGH
jgi:hypothetical protein